MHEGGNDDSADGESSNHDQHSDPGEMDGDVDELAAVEVCLVELSEDPDQHQHESTSRWPRTVTYSFSTLSMAFMIHQCPPQFFALHLPFWVPEEFLRCELSALTKQKIASQLS